MIGRDTGVEIKAPVAAAQPAIVPEINPDFLRAEAKVLARLFTGELEKQDAQALIGLMEQGRVLSSLSGSDLLSRPAAFLEAKREACHDHIKSLHPNLQRELKNSLLVPLRNTELENINRGLAAPAAVTAYGILNKNPRHFQMDALEELAFKAYSQCFAKLKTAPVGSDSGIIVALSGSAADAALAPLEKPAILQKRGSFVGRCSLGLDFEALENSLNSVVQFEKLAELHRALAKLSKEYKADEGSQTSYDLKQRLILGKQYIGLAVVEQIVSSAGRF